MTTRSERSDATVPRRFRPRLHAALLALLLTGAPGGAVVRAQEAHRLGVEESVRLALERNPRLQAADADAEAAAALRRSARAALLPSVVAQGGYTRLSDNIPAVEFTLPGFDSTFTFQGVELNRYQGELSVVQPLFAGGRLRALERAAAYEAEAAGRSAELARADVAYAVRRAYWELQRARAVQATLAAALAQVEEHVRDVRARLEEGTALRRDVLVAETRRSEVALERVETDNAARLAQLELSRLMGLPLDSELQPVDTPVVAAAEPDLTALTAAALAGHPELGVLALQARSLEARVRATRGERLPELDLTGRYLLGRPHPYFFAEQDRLHSTWELVLGGRWSIWAGGRQGAQTAEAQARLGAARARLADAREQVAVEVARRQLEVLRARAAAEAAAVHLGGAEETFRVVREQFAEGAALSADVLDAEHTLRRARAGLVGALADYEVARAAVRRALGQGG